MTERNVYIEPEERRVIRTKDVYQTAAEIGRTGYSDKLCSVVADFKNNGAPEGYNAQCMVGKSKRGEVAMWLYGVVDPDSDRFLKVGFKARGCLAMTACSSMIAQMIEGKSFEEALAIQGEDLKAELDGVPQEKSYAVIIAIEGVKALVGDYLVRQGASLETLDAALPCDPMSLPCLATEHCSLRDSRVELRLAQMKGDPS